MAGRWLLTNCAFVILCLSQLDARRSRQRATASDTDDEDSAPRAPEWNRRMHRERRVSQESGETLILSCPATGNPKPEITWLRDGALLQPDPSARRLRMAEGERMRFKNWNLKVFDVQPHQSGNYTCVITNDHGRLSWTFRVHIRKPVARPSRPVLVEEPRNQTVRAGRAARLSCRAHTDPEYQHLLGVQWLRHITVDGFTHDEDGYPFVTAINETKGRYAMPSRDVLIIEKTTSDDTGWYICMVDLAGFPEAITHVSMYINVKPQRIRPPSTTTTTTTIAVTENPTTSPTTVGRKRKKHRKKSRGRTRRPQSETQSPTVESSTHEVLINEPEVDSPQTEVNYVEGEVDEPEVRSSVDTENAAGNLRMGTLHLSGLIVGHFLYRTYDFAAH